MLAIRAEIDEIATGEMPQEHNILNNAPHTLALVSAVLFRRGSWKSKVV